MEGVLLWVMVYIIYILGVSSYNLRILSYFPTVVYTVEVGCQVSAGETSLVRNVTLKEIS